jgi:hypothetical protein
MAVALRRGVIRDRDSVTISNARPRVWAILTSPATLSGAKSQYPRRIPSPCQQSQPGHYRWRTAQVLLSDGVSYLSAAYVLTAFGTYSAGPSMLLFRACVQAVRLP